jgi:tetratricopeptide (TPR) repeat protein
MDTLDAIGWNNKGITFHSHKLYDEASEAYDRAIALDPDNPIFWRNKEKLLRDIKKQRSGRLESQSKIPSEEGKKTKPEDAIDWNNKGITLSRKGMECEAIAAFNQAISLDPTHPIFWKNKAKLLSKIGHKDEAKTAIALSDAITTQKNSEKAVEWNDMGYTLAEDGNYKEAITAFNNALEISPSFAEAWNNKGYSLAELGRTDEAISAFCKAIELNPTFARSWIENWFSLNDYTDNNEKIHTLQEFYVPKDAIVANEPPRFCDHKSGQIEMERVFTQSKDKIGKFNPCGWICPDCRQFRRM